MSDDALRHTSYVGYCARCGKEMTVWESLPPEKVVCWMCKSEALDTQEPDGE